MYRTPLSAVPAGDSFHFGRMYPFRPSLRDSEVVSGALRARQKVGIERKAKNPQVQFAPQQFISASL